MNSALMNASWARLLLLQSQPEALSHFRFLFLLSTGQGRHVVVVWEG